MGVTPCPSPRALRKPGSRKRTKHLAELSSLVVVVVFVVGVIAVGVIVGVIAAVPLCPA